MYVCVMGEFRQVNCQQITVVYNNYLRIMKKLPMKSTAGHMLATTVISGNGLIRKAMFAY